MIGIQRKSWLFSASSRLVWVWVNWGKSWLQYVTCSTQFPFTSERRKSSVTFWETTACSTHSLWGVRKEIKVSFLSIFLLLLPLLFCRRANSDIPEKHLLPSERGEEDDRPKEEEWERESHWPPLQWGQSVCELRFYGCGFDSKCRGMPVLIFKNVGWSVCTKAR